MTLRTLKMPVTIPNSPNLLFWKKKSISITDYDPKFKVTYLGNVITPWAKGEGCEEKPLQTLWKTHLANPTKPETHLPMELTISNSGLKAVTKKRGLVEYWAYRITYCSAPKEYPGVICWVYRHDTSKMKQFVRCHAALCSKPEQAKEIVAQLTDRLAFALQEFRREKLNRQKARLSLANACYDCPSMPRRKLLLYRGTINFKPPVEASKIAPKLTDIEENLEEEEEEAKYFNMLRQLHGSPSSLSDSYMYFEYSSSLDSDMSGCSLDENSPPLTYNIMGSLNSLGESSLSSTGSDDSCSSSDSQSDDSVDLSEHALLLS